MPYLTEEVPERGVARDVIPGVRRVVADNTGPMTYHGTNTFLIETPEGIVVLDPGPDAPGHLGAVAAAAEGRAIAVIVSHSHHDHCEGANRLARMLGTRVLGHPDFSARGVTIDAGLAEGDRVGGLEVLWTPGHARDHICLARDDGVLFTGDHVMAWSSSVVPHPSGDMAAFVASLERLRDRGDRLYLPGHGPALADPAPFVDGLIRFRRRREREILAEVAAAPVSSNDLTRTLYAKRGPHLFRAARNTVEAHLAKLAVEGHVTLRSDGRWTTTSAAPG